MSEGDLVRPAPKAPIPGEVAITRADRLRSVLSALFVVRFVWLSAG